MNNELHDMILKQGFKVTSVTNNNFNGKDVIIYKNDEDDIIMIEELSEKQRFHVKEIKKIHPVTGSVTSKEAEELMYASIIRRDTK